MTILLSYVAATRAAELEDGPQYRAGISWNEDQATLSLSVTAESLADVESLSVPIELHDAQGERLWNTDVTLKPGEGDAAQPGRLFASVELKGIADPRKQHAMDISLNASEHGLAWREQLYILGPKSTVQSYGTKATGIYPDRHVHFTLALAPLDARVAREIPLTLTIRDRNDTVVANRQASIMPSDQPSQHSFALTGPELAGSVGPYSLAFTAESEAHSLYFTTTARFAQPNTLLPVSSMETDKPNLFFASTAEEPKRLRTSSSYYSKQLSDLRYDDHPAVVFTEDQARSGSRGAAVTYKRGENQQHVWTRHVLPGHALAMRIWVKGNNTEDRLVAHFIDNNNNFLQAWHRNPNVSEATVCTLDFDGWREFRVPVLGNGLQPTDGRVSTENIDPPIHLVALSVEGPRHLPDGVEKGTPATFYIDDIVAETQVSVNEQLVLETRANDPFRQLDAESQITLAIGNGLPADLKAARVTIIGRDVEGQVLFNQQQEVAAPKGDWTMLDLSLSELAAQNPRGPVDVDITVVDPANPGARASTRLTYKASDAGGLVEDFEQNEIYSSFTVAGRSGRVGASQTEVVEGGANDSGHALAMKLTGLEPHKSALLHPTLPGIVSEVSFSVYAEASPDQPIVLKPMLIDSGKTGIWQREYDVFDAKPIKVDWTGWRDVTIQAPPVPAHYGDNDHSFLYEPWYPLNLVLAAERSDVTAPDPEDSEAVAAAEKVTPLAIKFDNVRVVTHLPADERQRMRVAFPEPTRIHRPGQSLRMVLHNYNSAQQQAALDYRLQSYQGFTAKEGQLPVTLEAGEKRNLQLIAALDPGLYQLHVTGFGKEAVTQPIMVLEPERYFAEQPLAFLADPLKLRRTLDLMDEAIYLDWDNTEPHPHMHHFGWFRGELNDRLSGLKNLEQVKAAQAKRDGAQARLAEAREALAKANHEITGLANEGAQLQRDMTKAKQAIAQARDALAKSKAESEKAGKDLAAQQEKLQKLKQAAAEADKKAKAAIDAAKQAGEELDQAAKAQQSAEKALAQAKKQAEAARAAAAQARKAADDAASQVDASAETKEQTQGDGETESQNAEANDQPSSEVARKQKAAEQAQSKADTAKAELDAAQQAARQASETLAKAKSAVTKADDIAEKAGEAQAAAAKAAKQQDEAVAEAQKAVAAAKDAQSKAAKSLEQAQQKLADLEARAKTITQQASKIKPQLDKHKTAVAKAEQAVTAADQEVASITARYSYHFLPVVGFSADWAGPEAVEAIADGSYERTMPNPMQVPARVDDWSRFARTVQREFHDRFDTWVFWENPDLDNAPQSVPPERYAPMLAEFHKWVKLYNPSSKVVAGGFNFSKILDYLAQFDSPESLAFDKIAIQMSLSELSPEEAEMEGFLDDVNKTLKLRETSRSLVVTELDWGINEFLSPSQHAAYHARAAMILDSRGTEPHRFNLLNSGYEFTGYGVFYREPYGSTVALQTFKPYHVPKPAYFALIETRDFLEHWQFIKAVEIPGRSPWDHRAFVYESDGQLAVAMWRALDGDRAYQLPRGWEQAKAVDAFGFPVELKDKLALTMLPTIIHLPEGYRASALYHELRTLTPTDGQDQLVLNLHLAEPDSRKRADHQASGELTTQQHAGVIPGYRKVTDTFVYGLTEERFAFNAPAEMVASGNLLLSRRWYYDGAGQSLTVQLNDGQPQAWDLSSDPESANASLNSAGVRDSTFVLRGVKAGQNTVTIRYDQPGNAAAYRIEPAPAEIIPLAEWGILNSRQTRGQVQTYTSVTGSPLTIGEQSYDTGLGAHSTSYIELPLAGQFQAFEVTVGIDRSTEGRGSVVYRLFVDGKEVADSGVINGFSKPTTLKVDDLAGAQRLILSVTDANDGDSGDLANWVDGKLILKP